MGAELRLLEEIRDKTESSAEILGGGIYALLKDLHEEVVMGKVRLSDPDFQAIRDVEHQTKRLHKQLEQINSNIVNGFEFIRSMNVGLNSLDSNLELNAFGKACVNIIWTILLALILWRVW
jgi:hypothetical protein